MGKVKEIQEGLLKRILRDREAPLLLLSVNVLAIKVKAPDGSWEKQIPDPGYVLCEGDLLVVMGPTAGLETLRPTRGPGDPGRSPLSDPPPPDSVA